MNKIVGFTVSKYKIDHSDIDVFNRGLKLLEFKKYGFYVYIWGINKIEECKINGKYTLSFPVGENLLDRNVLIYFENENIVIENDWLGSTPVFYNEKEMVVSTLSLKTLRNKEIHPEGLSNFVEFGYSVLEQTPFKCVKFMRYFSMLVINQQGITVVYKEDPALNEEIFNKTEDERIVFEKIKNCINDVEDITKGEIILPTSGGYDSRLLNLCINDKSRIRAFTYGISDNQSESSEVVHAKKLSEILGTQWEQIELGEFDRYAKDWFRLFGISTHLHGMYHIEFYKKILERQSFGQNVSFLSGINGGGWSGQVTVDKIINYNELTTLAYSHGANADKTQLLVQYNDNLRKQFFKRNKCYLENEKIRIIFLIRLKLILISYLTIIPEYFGFPVWTPFHNFDIVVSMLNLPEERRRGRAWQRDIFREHHLDLESMNLSKDTSNTLDYQAYMRHSFEPLDIQMLGEYFNKSYLEKINKIMLMKPPKSQEIFGRVNNRIMGIRYVGPGLRLLGFKRSKHKDILIASPYYVIKTIEMGLKN